ncbi:MAG: substrate-binding domain-containing protein [Clostridia bacterium]|nr:substrate-binding domain-containing protein [Clostridia bacterium]
MAKLSNKALEILTEVRRQILENRFGRPGDKFIGIRDLAAMFSVRTSTAQDVFETLRDEGILMFSQKKYFLSHGIIPSDSPLGKMRKERKLVALLCDHVESYYIPTFADSVAAYLQKEGYSLTLSLVTETSYRQDLRSLYDMGVQGFLVLPQFSLINKICRIANLPCVTSGYDCTEAGADCILSGGSRQAEMLADMMLEEGCKRFYFATPTREILEEKAIYKAFMVRLYERNVKIESDLIIGESEVRNNLNFLRKLLAKKEKIGIVCTNEQVTHRIMRWCDNNNVSVPKELMLAAFRTKSPMNQQRGEIITVEENIEKEAAEAAAVLLQRIRGDTSPPKVIVVEPKMINRIKE